MLAAGSAEARLYRSEHGVAVCPFPDLHPLRRNGQSTGAPGDSERCELTRSAQLLTAALAPHDVLCQPPFSFVSCTSIPDVLAISAARLLTSHCTHSPSPVTSSAPLPALIRALIRALIPALIPAPPQLHQLLRDAGRLR